MTVIYCNGHATAFHNSRKEARSSEENKNLFSASPEKYRPQFGANCAMSMTMGKLVKGDVRTWSIVDGRLVVQTNEKAARMWSKDAKGHLKKADGNWPTVVAKYKKKG